MDSGRLIIVCGLPGAGKTTLAKSLESQPRTVRLSPDEWMDALDINFGVRVSWFGQMNGPSPAREPCHTDAPFPVIQVRE
jgi:predicted kinase